MDPNFTMELLGMELLPDLVYESDYCWIGEIADGVYSVQMDGSEYAHEEIATWIVEKHNCDVDDLVVMDAVPHDVGDGTEVFLTTIVVHPNQPE